MIVDDESDIAYVMTEVLKRAGFDTVAYTSPAEALENYVPGSYDLVVLDIKMPGMTGTELFKRLRAKDDKLVAVFLTAFDTPPDVEEVVIRKPISTSMLITRVHETIKKKR